MHLNGDAEARDPAVIRVLIVIHAQNELREVRRALLPHVDIEVVGIMGNGIEAVRMLSNFRPDVVLIDLFIPGVEGLETTLRIKSRDKPPHVIVLTPQGGQAYQLAVEQAEADGYVPYPMLDQVLVPLIRSFSENGSPPKNKGASAFRQRTGCNVSQQGQTGGGP